MSSSNHQRLLADPDELLEIHDLVYSTPEILAILRQRHGEDFEYSVSGSGKISQKDLDRITSLVIPPAWSDVRIAILENAHLQAVGRDGKRRKQYRYHPLWARLRNQTKFYKMVVFGQRLPKIRKRVEEDLKQKRWTRTKVLALVIRLLEESHIRIGNDYYAKRNKTYGLSTLRTKHVEVYRDKINFEFTGKRGKKHNVTIRNKKLARLVNRCEEIPGWQLFQFFDESGNKHRIDSGMVNEYIKDSCGELFSAKDFRTWGASIIAFDTLAELGLAEDQNTRDKYLLQAIDVAAEALNNTRNVCRKYYVHPVIQNRFLDGSITPFFDKIGSVKREPGSTDLQNNEYALIELLKSYDPQLKL
ncbi:DNA topoisomerase-1 [Robiginitalea myxolifaciens]|uniref:DNA topoisomerase n=1 Tax=Robiginitalea myxolifaciens TaxID=400055 RepID=A0A1I6GCQ7_9FLAO|nr:DNA topoisomerase IB [Robiginitalea myxolifaciens]SFR39857.1 DNA topoisomerase-1 [Robiginitalea myxolifaciens]